MAGINVAYLRLLRAVGKRLLVFLARAWITKGCSRVNKTFKTEPVRDIESVTGLTPLTNAHLTFNNGLRRHRVTFRRLRGRKMKFMTRPLRVASPQHQLPLHEATTILFHITN